MKYLRSFAMCLCVFVALCLSLTGCCSMYMTSQHNSRVQAARMMKLQSDGKGIMLGIDLLNLDVPGYIAAWKADPWGMGAATVGDAAIGFGTYKLYEAVTDKSDSTTAATPTIQTSGGDVYIISGSGSSISQSSSTQSTSTDSHSTTTEVK